MRKITVLQILPALSSGGVERGTLETGAFLVAQGHRSLVVSAGGRMVDKLLAEGSEHVTWSVGKKSLLTLRYVFKLRSLLLREKVDVLHVRSRFPAWIAYFAWLSLPKSQRPALVSTVHGTYSVSGYSAVMTKGERVIVISQMIKDYVLKNYQVEPSHLRLIYRGVDPAQYHSGYQPDSAWKEAWFQQYPQTKAKKILLLPARVTRWKGQEDFIQLVNLLKQHRQDFHALIVGEVDKRKADYADELNRNILKLGLGGFVTLTGHRDDVKNIMAIANVVYSLSTAPEAFGRTTIEALSMGVPVIGYNHGGVGEQLAAMLPAGAVALNNVEAATELTLSWLDKAPSVASNSQFTLQNMLQNTLGVYQELMESRR